MDPVVEERLRKGAVMLGKFWTAGQRCAMGWSVKETDFPEGEDVFKVIERWACQCPQKTDFCKAKSHWFKLAMSDLRFHLEDEYGVALMMTAEEWDLTALTMKVDMGEHGVVSIGSKGVMSMGDLNKLRKAPDTLGSMLRVMKTFKGMRIQGVIEATPTAPAATAGADPLSAEVSGEEAA